MFATLRKRALVKLYAIPLTSNITASMTWAIGVLYALDLGADILQVNLITTIWSTMGIVLLVPFGILSDRLGRRPMLLYPRMVQILATLIRAFAVSPDHLLIAAFVGGFTGGGFFPVLLSMIADVAEPEECQEAISTLYLFSAIGMLVGPLIGSYLLTLPQFGLRSLYQIDLVAQVAVLLFMAAQVQESRPKPEGDSKVDYRAYVGGLLRQASFRNLLPMAFLYFFFNSVIGTYIPIFARLDLNLSDAQVASFATYRSLAIMLIRFSAATILTTVPTTRILLAALALGGLTGVATPFADSYLTLVLIFFLSGISFGATMVMGSTLVALNSTPRNRGVANGLYNIAQSTGNITKILTSPIAETQGLSPVFLLGGATAFLATVPILVRDDEH
jgi:MFS family permease